MRNVMRSEQTLDRPALCKCPSITLCTYEEWLNKCKFCAHCAGGNGPWYLEGANHRPIVSSTTTIVEVIE
jgi:hypothetical protein